MPELTGTRDLASYLRTFWRWKWLFICFVIAAPVVAFVINRSQPTVYRSSALVGINGTTVNSALVNGSGSFSTSNITAIAELVPTTPVAEVAAGLLNPPGNPGQIAGEITATGDPTTSFLTISAEDRSSVRAAAIANAFARAISLNLQQSAINQINSSIKTIRYQLAHLGPNVATKAGLQQQLNQLQVARSTTGSGAAILQAAAPSGTPAGGSLRRALEIAVLIGLLLGFGAVVLAERSDRRLRTPEDLERMTDLPLLGVIEPSAFAPSLHTTKEDDEAFQMLRTSLMYFNVDRDLDSVLITSAGEKEGKTTVSTRLAAAAATSGRDVILVDADLRRAQVSARLGVRAQEGLGSAIVGSVDAADVLVEVSLEGTPGAGRLQVLPAGPPPPNPAALMSSPKMEQLIRQLELESDLVIVDTPAALAVSDPLPLMRAVTGVVVVARMNISTRQTIRRLQKIIEAAHGRLLGVVATGASAGLGYSHYYPAYYAQNGNGTHPRRFANFRRSHFKPAPDPESAVATKLEPPGAKPGEAESE
jgi:capsular exopolysaccharide synthesis family protein